MRITHLTIFVALLLGCLLAAAVAHSAPDCEAYQMLFSGQPESVALSSGAVRCFEIFVAEATVLNVNIESNGVDNGFDLHIGYDDDPTNSPAISFPGSTDLVYPVWMDGYWRFALASRSNSLRLVFQVTLTGAPEIAMSAPGQGASPLSPGFTRIPINDPSRSDSVTLSARDGRGDLSAQTDWSRQDLGGSFLGR